MEHPIPRLRPLKGFQPNFPQSAARKGDNCDVTKFVSKADQKVGVVDGDRGVSSNRVSIARSRAPTDLAVLLVPCPECDDEAAERLRVGIRVEYADSDDFEDRGDEVGDCILFVPWLPFFKVSFPLSYSESEST